MSPVSSRSRGLANVAVNEGDAGLAQARDIELRPASVEVVERHELPVGVAAGQLERQVRAHEAGAARDENPHPLAVPTQHEDHLVPVLEHQLDVEIELELVRCGSQDVQQLGLRPGMEVDAVAAVEERRRVSLGLVDLVDEASPFLVVRPARALGPSRWSRRTCSVGVTGRAASNV